jgi:hypothetical protein
MLGCARILSVLSISSWLLGRVSPSTTPSPTVLVDFGTNCTYSVASQSTSLSLSSGSTSTVATIPAGRMHVFVELLADADLDLKLTALGTSTTLLSFEPWVNWNHYYMQQINFHMMNIKACVDECVDSVNATYHNGAQFSSVGNSEKGKEFLYINETSEDLLLEVRAYESGTGSIYWSWDCDFAKCNDYCVGITSPPTAAPTTVEPSVLPTPVAPTQAPSFVPTPPPSVIPTAAPIAPTSVPTHPPSAVPIPSPSRDPTSPPTPSPSSLALNQTCSFYAITAGEPPQTCADAISNCFRCFACCDDVASKLFVAGDLSFQCRTTVDGYGKHCESVGTYTCGCHPRVKKIASSTCNTTWGQDAARQCSDWHLHLP